MRVSLSLLGLVLLAAGCSRELIPNTDVEDTEENRAVVDFVEKYRKAVADRDVSALLALADDEYYDDMGTPDGTDDVDRGVLEEQLKGLFTEDLLKVHYDIRYRDVTVLPTKVLVDYTYIGRFKINTPEGPRWERRLADNRLVLAREGDVYSILSGM